MDKDAVWLYSVIDHKNMNIEELQAILNKWSDDPTPHELLICGDKMIMKFQSGLLRSAYFAQKRASRASMEFGA